jgi:Protein of unknown function (DUF4446)
MNSSSIPLFFAGLACLVCIGLVIRLEMKLRRLTRGSDGASLEGHIGIINDKVAAMEDFNQKVIKAIADLNQRTSTALRGVATVHFNALGRETTQSFATAYISEIGKGVVFSTVRVREVTHIYAKPIENFKPLIELTAEESSALKTAVDSIQK